MVETISEDAGRNWILASQARALVQELVGADDEDAASVLVRWAAADDVTARCRLHRHWSDDYPTETTDERDILVPSDFWHAFGNAGQAKRSDWRTGEFEIEYFQSPFYYHVVVTGVEFDADQIHQRAPAVSQRPPAPAAQAPPPALAPPTPAKHPGGPKRKPYWDDLWIEVIRRVRAGTLHTEKATELESILDDIVEDLGHPRPGDSTLKPMSLKLFKYLRESGG